MGVVLLWLLWLLWLPPGLLSRLDSFSSLGCSTTRDSLLSVWGVLWDLVRTGEECCRECGNNGGGLLLIGMAAMEWRSRSEGTGSRSEGAGGGLLIS